MGDHAGTEEALVARVGQVDELIDDNELPRRQFLAEGTDCRNSDHVGTADAFKRIDIGARIDVGRRQAMPAPVAGEKDEFNRADPAGQQLVRWYAPRRVNRDPARLFKRVDRI